MLRTSLWLRGERRCVELVGLAGWVKAAGLAGVLLGENFMLFAGLEVLAKNPGAKRDYLVEMDGKKFVAGGKED